ncbi:MAG: ferrochelatase [Gemmataceae bacterium]|nr:ferrochelatase [Gemmataceae bacterium]MCI0738067.1 ferrochelatase [Gemmataceae bacterium]
MQKEVSNSHPSPLYRRGLGILLIQLGTPDAPTPQALRPYLRQFLSDRRVIDVPRWKWWPILQFILLRRPKQSAAKYQRIWDPVTGSPLLHWTKRQTDLVQACFSEIPVRFGMQVGNPPLGDVVDDMIRSGVERLIVLPMYPQYSATTTASATDILFSALQKQRRVPALRIVPPYYDHPAYLDAVVAVIRADLAKLSWPPEHFLLSFHGIPMRYAQSGDPYATHVKRTTFALIERLGWPKAHWTQTFQSLFGRERWLKPYTEEKLKQLAKKGVKRVFVAMPGFTADCLETLDEIGNEARDAFIHAGGEKLRACPCLNDHPTWIDAMRTIIAEEGRGWI